MGRTLLLTLLFGALAGCSTMSASRVQDVSGNQALLKVSSADGATAGQAFEVYRNHRIMYGNPSKQPLPTYRTETVGCVQVTEVVDAHHAKASISHGNVETRDFARATTACPLPDKG